MFGTVIIFPNSANFGRIVWNSEKVVFLERAVAWLGVGCVVVGLIVAAFL